MQNNHRKQHWKKELGQASEEEESGVESRLPDVCFSLPPCYSICTIPVHRFGQKLAFSEQFQSKIRTKSNDSPFWLEQFHDEIRNNPNESLEQTFFTPKSEASIDFDLSDVGMNTLLYRELKRFSNAAGEGGNEENRCGERDQISHTAFDDFLCFVIGNSLAQRDLRPRERRRQKSGLEVNATLSIHLSADTGRLFPSKGKNPQGYIDVFSPEVRFCPVFCWHTKSDFPILSDHCWMNRCFPPEIRF